MAAPFEGLHVKETADGNCIYCPKCVARHKFLDEESKKLCIKWGIDTVAFAKQIDKEEKRLLKEIIILETRK